MKQSVNYCFFFENLMTAGVTNRFVLVRPYLYLIPAFDAGNEFQQKNTLGTAGALLLLAEITALQVPSSSPRVQACPSGLCPIS
jgi:hypothetical protein